MKYFDLQTSVKNLKMSVVLPNLQLKPVVGNWKQAGVIHSGLKRLCVNCFIAMCTTLDN